MSAKVYFISDLHLGHKKILKFSNGMRGGTTVDEHDDWIVETWNSIVRKRDVVYVLGDVAFNCEALWRCLELNGQKKLVLGNHDLSPISAYEAAGFKILPSLYKYKEFWLSHAPIHPDELRGRVNIHGHTHATRMRGSERQGPVLKTFDDPRYVNVCVEQLSGRPLLLGQLRAEIQRRGL